VDSGSNTIKNVFPTAPGGSQILLWNGSGFVTAIYSTLLGGHWKTNGVTADGTLIAPGHGFFVQAASKFTNTFIGSVTPASGVTANTTIPAGLQLVSSLVPYNDYATNKSTVNLTNVTGGTQILLWNPSTQAFNTYIWSTLLGGHWKLNGVNTDPLIPVGKGFFFNAGGSYVWQQVGP